MLTAYTVQRRAVVVFVVRLTLTDDVWPRRKPVFGCISYISVTLEPCSRDRTTDVVSAPPYLLYDSGCRFDA